MLVDSIKLNLLLQKIIKLHDMCLNPKSNVDSWVGFCRQIYWQTYQILNSVELLNLVLSHRLKTYFVDQLNDSDRLFSVNFYRRIFIFNIVFVKVNRPDQKVTHVLNLRLVVNIWAESFWPYHLIGMHYLSRVKSYPRHTAVVRESDLFSLSILMKSSIHKFLFSF